MFFYNYGFCWHNQALHLNVCKCGTHKIGSTKAKNSLFCIRNLIYVTQGYINRSTCSYPELTSCHVLTSAYVIIFWAVARNAVNKSVWRKKTVLDFPSTNMQWISLFKHQQMWACFSRPFLLQKPSSDSWVICFIEACLVTMVHTLWDIEHSALRHTEHGALRHRARCSETQSTVLWEPEHTGAPCSPRAHNLLYVLISRIVGYNDLCSPARV